jgi:photosystem II stability/assembly factor-like uncharacterized protein
MSVTVIAGTQKGAMLYRSDRGRERWEPLGFRIEGWLVTATARDASGCTYAAVSHAVYGAAVLVSDDLERWEQLEAQPRFRPEDRGNEEHNRIVAATDAPGRGRGAGRYVDQIWKLHFSDGALYAGVSEAGLFRSDDRGKSWEPVAGLNDHPDRGSWLPGAGGLCAHTVLTDARDPRRIWVGISAAGVFRSDDGGATFHQKDAGVSRDEGVCVHCLAHDPRNADVIFRQDHRGMYLTRDGGDSWELIESGLPLATLGDDHECAFGFAAAHDPETGYVYAVPLAGDGFRYPHGGRLRVYRTRNGGESWEPLGRGLPDGCYAAVLRGAMAVDGLDPGGVYFGDTSGNVYASPDLGERWIRLPGTLPRVLSVEAYAQ